MFTSFRERGLGTAGSRGRKRNMDGKETYASVPCCPQPHRVHNPGMCPDRAGGSTPQQSGVQDNAQPTKPPSQGLFPTVFFLLPSEKVAPS